MMRVALRPKWVLFLLFVMALAAVFAFLGKWQLETALVNSKKVDQETEIVVPLSELLAPTSPVPTTSGGHMTEVSGVWVPESFTVLHGRLNFGESGYWLVGRLITEGEGDSAVSIPVAWGWSPSEEEINSALVDAAAIADSGSEVNVIGRLMPSEAPVPAEGEEDPLVETTISVASLVNTWPDYSGAVYSAYIIAENPPVAGLEAIESVPPQDDTSINWLNIFYAVEWVVFAGFAFYIWYRMVRDEWEAEEEERELAEKNSDESSREKPDNAESATRVN